MGQSDASVGYPVRTLLNRTIEALLSEGTIEERISEANNWIRRLEQHKHEVPAEFIGELKRVTNDVAQLVESRTTCCSVDHLPLELTSRLLALYVDVSDGALIF